MKESERATLFTVYEQLKRAHDTLMSMSPEFDREKYSVHIQQTIIFFQQSLQLTQVEIEKEPPPTRLHTLGRIRDCCKSHVEIDTPSEDQDCHCEIIEVLLRYIGDEVITHQVENRPKIPYELP